jgi:hypothetical protein
VEITVEQLLQFLGEECAKVKLLEGELERLRQLLNEPTSIEENDEPDADSDDGKP